MRTRLYITMLALAGLMGSGCSKYVDIKTQGVVVPGSLDNYRTLLNSTSNFEASSFLGDYSSDDVSLVDGSSQMLSLSSSDYYSYYLNAYAWKSTIYSPTSSYYYRDDNWNKLYNVITYANIIISEVPAANDGTTDEKNEMVAEALVHRAYAYLELAGCYAKPYQAATAGSDLGVPLVLVQTTTQSLARATMQATYNQVIADLKKAALSLPTSQAYTFLPDRAAAYGVLARTYLYMNLYDSASRYADSALAYHSGLNDLSTITALGAATYPLRFNDPEILLSKISGSISAYSPTALRLSDTLLSVLGTADKRYQLFTTGYATITTSYAAAGGRYFYKDRAMGEGRNNGPTVPEMMLIKAEAYARGGNAAPAMSLVNTLRKKRFAAADYQDLAAADANDALLKVIQEREREFFCRTLRWWDMRRLKSESKFQYTVTRSVGGVTLTLAPESNRYVFPISAYDISLNPEIQPNP